jgi:hypothetical protein
MNLVSDQVAGALSKLGISYEYEQKLPSKDNPNDFRLPDFTVSYEGDTFYWEHLGMLSVPSYKEAWYRKRQWYEDNGFLDRVITSEDGLDGSIDAAENRATAIAVRGLCPEDHPRQGRFESASGDHFR